MRSELQVGRESVDFVSTINLGSTRVTAISAGILYWAPELNADEATWRAAMPEADVEGRIACALITVVIEMDDAVILVDPGPDEPDTAWSARFAREWPGSSRTPGLEAGLRAAGISTDAITHVVITHAHFDHFAAVTRDVDGRQTPRFPHADYVMHAAEWEDHPGSQDPASDLVLRLGAVNQAGKLRLVRGETLLIPGVDLVPAPGETPGHMAVRIRSRDEVLWVVGDLAHHACEVANLDWVPTGRDLAAMVDSRQRIYADAAETDAVVVFTHERFPPWGRITRSGSAYRWERLSADMSQVTPPPLS